MERVKKAIWYVLYVVICVLELFVLYVLSPRLELTFYIVCNAITVVLLLYSVYMIECLLDETVCSSE